MAYHATLSHAPGGFFGVDVFFVISGYLVTSIFLARAHDVRGPGRAETLDFWRRRVLRLVPAAVAAVLVTCLVFALLDARSLGDLLSEGLAATGYIANWFFLFREQSYFETMAQPSPFLHFWSLGVEAQFYLLWPLLLIAALRFGGRLSAFALAVSLAALSTLVVAALYTPLGDPSRAYYGTDARAAGLLLGASVAIVLRPGIVGRGVAGAGLRLAAEAAGWAGLLVLAWMVMQVSEFDPFIYRGGFFVASTATVGVLLAALHGQNTVARLLSLAPLRWVGQRSYSIYLWHWPVFVLTQPQMSADLHSVSLLIARLGATLILAELSYRLVENRFRAGHAPAWPRFEWGAGPYLQRAWARPAAVVGVGLVAIVLAGGLPMRSGLAGQIAPELVAEPIVGADQVSPASQVVLPPDEGTSVATPAVDVTPATPTPTPQPTEVVSPGSVVVNPTSTVEPTPAEEPAVEATATPESTPEPPEAQETPSSGSSSSVSGDEPASVTPVATPGAEALGATVTVIGDSVLLGAAPALETALPGAVVDALVGRQFWTAPDVIAGLRAQGALGDIVVIHLGANGPFTDAQFQAVMDALDGVSQVIFVTVTVPRRWESDVNDSLVSHAAETPRVSIADWHAASVDHSEYFGPDGVHLTGTGREAYAALLQQSVTAVIAGAAH